MDSKMGYDTTDSKIDIEISVLECTICFVNEQNKVLPCEHKVCVNCYENIEVCPFCRKNIIKPITDTNTDTNAPNTITTSIYRNVDVEEEYDRKFYVCMTIITTAPICMLFYGMIMWSIPR